MLREKPILVQICPWKERRGRESGSEFVGALRGGPFGSNSLGFGEYSPLTRAGISALQRLWAESAGNLSRSRRCRVGKTMPPGSRALLGPQQRFAPRSPGSPALPRPVRGGRGRVWPPGVPPGRGKTPGAVPAPPRRGESRGGGEGGRAARSRVPGLGLAVPGLLETAAGECLPPSTYRLPLFSPVALRKTRGSKHSVSPLTLRTSRFLK